MSVIQKESSGNYKKCLEFEIILHGKQFIKVKQKQPREVFSKKRFHRKTPVLESLFNKVTYVTRNSNTGVFL